MEQKVEEIIREILELPGNFDIRDDMSAETVEEWDSLVSMQLVLALEKEYHVKFDYNEIINMETIGDIKKILREKIE